MLHALSCSLFLFSRRLFAIAIQKTRFRGYELYYENETATHSMIRASDEFPSFFEPRESEPLIIDCGANIGISVLEWKTRWPMSRIICFEPDPDAFRLLSLNMESNDIPGVKCIHAAVADFDGKTLLFGDMGHGADARGNSIQPQWGEREASDSVEVRCCKLSPYLAKQEVSFLKMDIEGAEESVLRESFSQLHKVDALYVEVHETDEMMDQNSSDRIEKMLLDASFQMEKEMRFQPHSLPPDMNAWQQSVNANQTQFLAWRE
jgi:FkbM family methyltransferase